MTACSTHADFQRETEFLKENPENTDQMFKNKYTYVFC